ncbi:MAG: hypothetical protein ACOC9O_03410 [Myxococcota bacterium]
MGGRNEFAVLWIVLALGYAGCSDASDPATGDDGGADAQAPDAHAPDGGSDAGLPDAGSLDSGASDAGSSPDAGSPDAGSLDAGSLDAGTLDAAPLDGSPLDGGSADPCDDAVCFSDVHPIFNTKCSPCHAGGGSGGHDIGHPDIETAYADSQLSSYHASGSTKGHAALIRIQEGSMPLGRGCTGDPAQDAGNPDCLTQTEQDLIQAWLDDGQLGP